MLRLSDIAMQVTWKKKKQIFTLDKNKQPSCTFLFQILPMTSFAAFLPLPAARIIIILLVVMLPPSAFAIQAAPPGTVAYKHEQAVLLARKGQLHNALIQLRKLHSQLPNNSAIINDLIVISSWAGRYHEAKTLFERKKPDTYPEYVRYAMVNVYRNLQKPETGLLLLHDLLQRHPDNVHWQLRKALLLIDSQHLDQAEKILVHISAKASATKDFYLASAYLHEAQKDWLAAIGDYEDVCTLLPRNNQLLRKEILAMNHIRAPLIALKHMDNYQNLLSKSEIADLLTGRAAQLLRWSTDAQKDFRETRLFSLKALSLQLEALALLAGSPSTNKPAKLDQNGRPEQTGKAPTSARVVSTHPEFLNKPAKLDQNGRPEQTRKAPTPARVISTQSGFSTKQQRQIYFDMIISLRNLRQMNNVQTLYTALAQKGPMPDYVRQALAGSLLAAHKPDQARKIYKKLVDKNPKNYQASRGLFYAYVEDEDFSHAYTLIDSMAKHEPKYLSFWDSKIKYPNEQYMDLRVTAIQARFYGDQLEDAWNGIDALVNRAPVNNWLREVRGQISNARDWPRQGLDDFRIADLLTPGSLDAIAGKGASLIQLHRFKEAKSILQYLQDTHPFEHPTRNLARQWEFSRKPSYYSDIVFSNSSGPDLNGNGILASTEIISSPIDDSWYISAAYRHAWNEIIEGEETFKRSSAGLEYRKGDWDLLGHLTYNDSTINEIGGNLKAVWQPDDHWSVMLAGERFAVSTPLRALHHDIRADALSTALTYRTSEQRDISGSLQFSDFTDNNSRIEGSARFRQRFVDIPHLDIDGRMDLYGSKNSKTNVPYYNPEHDFSLQGALHVDHVYYRHYAHLLAQQLDVGYGFYDQKGFAARWIGHVRYEHRYRFSPWMEMLAGVEFGQNVYDGHAEPYRLLRFMINGKF